MGKVRSSGGGSSSLFTSKVVGPPPGPLTVSTNEWIELANIPVGKRIWIGSGQYGSPDKSITFEIRVNLTGQSAGSDGATQLLGSTSASVRSGTVTADYYKNGSLHLASVVGTGTEKFWLRLKSKSGTAGSYFYSVNYTEE